MKATGSISKGRLAPAHNMRDCYRKGRCPDNIDLTRTDNNVVLENRPIADVYQERFGLALLAYNAEQQAKGRASRQIPDYLAHVRASKQTKEAYEFVVQVGNKDVRPDDDTCIAVLTDWYMAFKDAYSANFATVQAVVHTDEATPHMHVEIVPVAESTRGLRNQNSMNKAVKQAGFTGKGAYKDMLAAWDQLLTDAMADHGIERIAGDRDKQLGGVDIGTYKKTMQWKEGKEREQALSTMRAERERDRIKDDIEMNLYPQVEELTKKVEALKDVKDRLQDECKRLGDDTAEQAERLEEVRRAAALCDDGLGDVERECGRIRRYIDVGDVDERDIVSGLADLIARLGSIVAAIVAAIKRIVGTITAPPSAGDPVAAHVAVHTRNIARTAPATAERVHAGGKDSDRARGNVAPMPPKPAVGQADGWRVQSRNYGR